MFEKPNKWIVCISYTFNDTLSRADLINKYWTKITSKLDIFIVAHIFFVVIKRSSLKNTLKLLSGAESLAKILNSFIRVFLN